MLNALSARIMTWATAARNEEGQGLVEYALILVARVDRVDRHSGVLGIDVDAVFTTSTTALTAPAADPRRRSRPPAPGRAAATLRSEVPTR